MAGLPKKYWKLYPGNLKKAWAAFKSSRGEKKTAKKTAKKAKKSYHKTAPQKAKKEGTKMKKHVKKAAHHAKRHFGKAMATTPVKILTSAGIAAAGGVATSFAINKLPKVKDFSPTTKSAIQAAAGLAAVMFGKKQIIKSLGSGAIIAAVFGLSKSVLKLDPLAGPGAGAPTLTADQMRRLLGGQMNMPSNVRMNVPAPVRMRGAPVMPFGSGGWSNSWG